jgi:hypothetical protein
MRNAAAHEEKKNIFLYHSKSQALHVSLQEQRMRNTTFDQKRIKNLFVSEGRNASACEEDEEWNIITLSLGGVGGGGGIAVSVGGAGGS